MSEQNPDDLWAEYERVKAKLRAETKALIEDAHAKLERVKRERETQGIQRTQDVPSSQLALLVPSRKVRKSVADDTRETIEKSMPKQFITKVLLAELVKLDPKYYESPAQRAVSTALYDLGKRGKLKRASQAPGYPTVWEKI